MEFIKKFLTLEFWFRQHDYSQRILIIILILFSSLILIGIIWRVISKKGKKKDKPKFLLNFYRRLGNYFITLGVIGLIFGFFSHQNIYLFGLRFWYLVLLIVAIIWGIKHLKFYSRRIPQIKKQKKEHDEFQRYLPKRKK